MLGKGGMGGGTELREDMAVVMVEPIVMLVLLKLLLKLGMLPMLVVAKVEMLLLLGGSCAEAAVVAVADVLLKP